MSAEQNKALVLRLLREVSRSRDVIDELCTEDFVRHLPMGFVNNGRQEFRAAEDEMIAAFEGLHVEPTHAIAEGDLVALRFVMTATHTGAWSGIQATGAEVETTGQLLARVVDGRIAEVWEEFDFYRFIQQLRDAARAAELRGAAVIARPV